MVGVRSKRSVVQCVIIEKKGRHAGCASVIFESPDHLTTLQRVESSLTVGNPPRLLRIKEGDNRHLQRRYNSMCRDAHQSRSLSLSAAALELCVNHPTTNSASTATNVQQQEDTTTATDILWRTQESDSSFKLSINTNKKCITSMFQIIPDGSEQQPKEDGKGPSPSDSIFDIFKERLLQQKSDKYMLQISLKKIRNVLLGRDSSNGNIVLAFQVKHPPRLYRYVPKDPFGSFTFGKGVVSNFVWRLGPGDTAVETTFEGDDEDDYVRTLDPTSVNAFGRALWYRFVFGPLQEYALNDLVRKLQEFALLNPTEAIYLNMFVPVTLVPHSPNVVSAGQSDQLLLHEVWNALQSCQVQPSTMYLLHCLHGANKMDLLTWLRRSRDFFQSVQLFTEEGVSVQRLNSILENCFYDATLYYIEELSTCITRKKTAVSSFEESAGEKADSEFLDESEDNMGDDSDSIYEEEDDGSLDVLLVGRVVVTPTRICPQPAVREQSNRVIREFSRFKERFVRIAFVDDNFGSILGAKSEDIFNLRILKIMESGFVVAGRKFVFLAFSNSQIRDQSCWFYDETIIPGEGAAPTASFIRNWIGDLSSIRIIGKYAARLGQGFSTTLPVAKFSKTQICDVPDVKRNGFCFSDGVGMISMTCAKRASIDMGLRYIPSAFQVRYGGAKGMLTVMPDAFLISRNNSNHQPCEIAFRESMRKFPSEHNQLEINSYAKPMPCFLNRQLITLLSTRGVSNRVFLDLLNDMIGDFDAALRDNESAQLLVQRHSGLDFDFHSPSIWTGVWHLLSIGVQVKDDLYVSGLIIAIRNSLLLELQTKARIFVKKGVCLIGVMDETNTLKPGEVFMQISAKKFGEAPRVFDDGCHMLVGRNPSLHPGDLRKLRVRNLPALSHLVDVIVFPSLGERPHPDEMSGGDLDGDIYFAIWDSNLIPLEDFPPMEYSGAGPAAVPPQSSLSADGVVTHSELVRFFVNYIRNDNLGMIANAHLVFADVSCKKAASNECIQLAKLHSTAVDFVKSGIPAVLDKDLKVKQYPTFLEKPFQASYESSNILGQIYTIAMKKKTTSYNNIMMGGGGRARLKVEERFLVEGFQAYLDDAIDNMSDYNHRLWRIMQRYGVTDEMEILSGHVRNFSRKVCPKGGKGKDEVLKRLARDIKVLRKYFWDVFWEEFSTEEGMDTSSGGPYYNYPMEVRKKAAAWYFETYHQEVFDYPPLVSFPWIVAGVLCTNCTYK